MKSFFYCEFNYLLSCTECLKDYLNKETVSSDEIKIKTSDFEFVGSVKTYLPLLIEGFYSLFVIFFILCHNKI